MTVEIKFDLKFDRNDRGFLCAAITFILNFNFYYILQKPNLV